jgi:hypothetical protein
MAISRVHTWIANEVLTASDLNAEFNNVLNNAVALISPLTANLDFNNNKAVNFRFEVQASTQSATQQGRAYYQSTERSLHVDSGTVILRAPLLQSPIEGRLLGTTNPSGVSGATLYNDIVVGAGLTLSGQTLSATGGSGNPLSAAVFN